MDIFACAYLALLASATATWAAARLYVYCVRAWRHRRSAKRYNDAVYDLKRRCSVYHRMRLHRVIQRIAQAEAGTYGRREAAMVVMGCVRDNKKHTAETVCKRELQQRHYTA